MANYLCPACKKTLWRDSEKQWVKSYCEQKGRDVRLQKISQVAPCQTPETDPDSSTKC
jgi:hypothetical protein